MSGTTTSTPSNVAADVHFAAHEPANQMLPVGGRRIAKLETFYPHDGQSIPCPGIIVVGRSRFQKIDEKETRNDVVKRPESLQRSQNFAFNAGLAASASQ
jgi:hypothetical protein